MTQSLPQLFTESAGAIVTQNRASRKRRWLLLLLLLLMQACGLPDIAFHPIGQIVFECWPERQYAHLCLVNADGSNYRQLTSTKSQRPSWSSDGKRVVFEQKGLSIIDLNSKVITHLTDDPAAQPAWSPDGSHIAFFRFNTENNDKNIKGIYVMKMDATNETCITDITGYDPAWSPDGAKIAFTVYLGSDIANPRIYIMNSDGSNQMQLTDIFSTAPAWSPDGKKIAFASSNGNAFAISTINQDGSGLTQVSDSGLSPSWSPDGQYIVYYKRDPACFICPMSGQLWVMRADGSQQTKITNGPVDQNPVWGPVP